MNLTNGIDGIVRIARFCNINSTSTDFRRYDEKKEALYSGPIGPWIQGE